MLALTYAILLIAALLWLSGVLAGALPSTIGAAFSVALWVALIPASYSVDLVVGSSIETVAQPSMAFLAVGGAAISAAFLFADVTGRISRQELPVVGSGGMR